MSRKRCIRKHYPLVDPVRMALEGAAITQKSMLDKLRLVELSAIESFAKGRATVADWKALADMLNVAQTMASAGCGPEVLPACDAVQAALDDSHRRHRETKRLGMTGSQLQALRELAEWHQLQRSSISRGEYGRFIDLTARRIRSAHPDSKVLI